MTIVQKNCIVLGSPQAVVSWPLAKFRTVIPRNEQALRITLQCLHITMFDTLQRVHPHACFHLVCSQCPTFLHMPLPQSLCGLLITTKLKKICRCNSRFVWKTITFSELCNVPIETAHTQRCKCQPAMAINLLRLSCGHIRHSTAPGDAAAWRPPGITHNRRAEQSTTGRGLHAIRTVGDTEGIRSKILGHWSRRPGRC
jgi:hypothetical protein